eukprot:2461193-Rhodomonas_salina.1
MRGCLRVCVIVSVCMLCTVVLAALLAAAGFFGQTAFYVAPMALFFLWSAASSIKRSCGPERGKWFPGDPKYWLSILVGAIVTGCAVGYNLPPVWLLMHPTVVDSLKDVTGEPTILEFKGGLTPLLPPFDVEVALQFVGAYQLSEDSKNVCHLVVGLIDFVEVDLTENRQPEGGFSLSAGCKAEGLCTEQQVLSTCLSTVQSTCCGPRGAISTSSSLPWSMELDMSFPVGAVDDFKRKNTISEGYAHVEFHDFDSHITRRTDIMLGCIAGGLGASLILSAYFAVTSGKSKVADSAQERKYKGNPGNKNGRRGDDDGYHSDTSYDY